jgi:hypothetical protein
MSYLCCNVNCYNASRIIQFVCNTHEHCICCNFTVTKWCEAVFSLAPMALTTHTRLHDHALQEMVRSMLYCHDHTFRCHEMSEAIFSLCSHSLDLKKKHNCETTHCLKQLDNTFKMHSSLSQEGNKHQNNKAWTTRKNFKTNILASMM